MDDHQLFRDGLRALLEADHAVQVVGEASDAASAMQMLADTACDVALVDLSLGRGCGVELTEQIVSRHRGLPVLILSMHDEPEKVRAALRAGASGYVLKTIGREELVTAIQAAARGGTYFCGQIAAPLLQSLRRPEASDVPRLTEREQSVLRLVVDGDSNTAIAGKLHLSVSRIKVHLNSLFSKFGVSDRTTLAVEATARGFSGA